MMELVNELYKAREEQGEAVLEDKLTASVWREALDALVLLLSPMVPHLAEELWHHLGHTTSVYLEPWPQADTAAMAADTRLVVIQVNGKLRSKMEVAVDADDELSRNWPWLMSASRNCSRAKHVKKIVVARQKLVNIVI